MTTPLRTLFKALSAERRAWREAGLSARYAIWMQTRGAAEIETARYRRNLKAHTEAEVKLAVRQWDMQDRRCYLCGHKLRTIGTREHVVPQSLGGKDHLNTLRAHAHCNVKKANRPPYPCELLYLDALNLNLGLTDEDWTPPADRPFCWRGGSG